MSSAGYGRATIGQILLDKIDVHLDHLRGDVATTYYYCSTHSLLRNATEHFVEPSQEKPTITKQYDQNYSSKIYISLKYAARLSN